MTESTDAAEARELRESDPNGGGRDGLSGQMGVSSERTGKVRGTPGEVTHGTENTAADERPPDAPPA